MKQRLAAVCLLIGLFPGSFASAQAPRVTTGSGAEFNAAVLQAIKRMPSGGGYAATTAAKQNLAAAVRTDGDRLSVRADGARPSFCSSATYLVFTSVLADLEERGEIHLSPTDLQALRVAGQRDGEGVWGRWNANGPGTARLFNEAGLGENFTDWSRARPGDFMKIFWTREIGARERGHSVIFLGTEMVDGVEQVRFWSSNLPGGYGERVVPRAQIIWAIFSRLTRPARASRMADLPEVDKFLSNMLTRGASRDEVGQQCGF